MASVTSMTGMTNIAEFRINKTTEGIQENPSVTALFGGGFVVAWESENQDGGGYGVYGQRYDAEGRAQGAEFRIATTTQGNQTDPSVTALSGGGFVVAWTSLGQDGGGEGVYARRYDADGNAQGAEFPINSTTEGNQDKPSVTALSNGGFVVAWESFGQDGSGDGVYARRYDADGNAQGAEFWVNAHTASNQDSPSVTGLSNGGFVVAWQSSGQDGNLDGVYARRYDAAGNTQGAEFRIATTTQGNQTAPSVTGLSNGGFVVAWESDHRAGNGDDVYARRYDAEGRAQGGEFQINTYTASDQRIPSVTALSDGGFVVAWVSSGQDGSGAGVYAQRYDANGKGLGAEFRINTYTQDSQWDPSVTGLSNGGFVVAWESNGQDGDGDGVYGQRFPPGTVMRRGTDGDDTSEWGEGADLILGLAGNDTLDGGAGADLIDGGVGNDWITGGAGRDTLGGGDGFDRAFYEGSDAGVNVSLTTGIGRGGHAEGDRLIGIEFLTGSIYDDTLAGDNDNNRIDGGLGADRLVGGGGNDLLTGGAGRDTLRGGEGFDRAIYKGSYAAVDVNLGAGTARGGHAKGDRLIGIEHLTGSKFADTLTGDDGNNRFDGGLGKDLLDGGAGHDWLTGGAGMDTLIGGAGIDRAVYAGSDAGVTVNLATGTGEGGHAEGDRLMRIENLTGSDFDDMLTGDYGNNRFTGGAGRDTLDGGGGRDLAVYAISDEGVSVNLATGTGEGGHAQGDVLTDIEHLIGSKFADTLAGDNGDNRLDGGAGNDSLTGGAGNDLLTGGAGADTLDGGLGRDRAIYAVSDAAVSVTLVRGIGQGGQAEGDVLRGIEDLIGSVHGDTLTGNGGDNRLEGGAGNDWLKGGVGRDTLDGGLGVDGAFYTGSDAAVSVDLGAGTVGGGHAEGDILIGIEHLIGSVHGDTLAGDDGDNRLAGGLGKDLLQGGAGRDVLEGGLGIDWLIGGDGTDVLNGGAGRDVLNGGEGSDRAIYAGSDAGVTVNLGTGTGQGGFAEGDRLTGIENLTGSDRADRLTGDDGNNRLEGGAEKDWLTGGAGRDTLDGGDGDDWLTGGAGADTLDGGLGFDRAIYMGSDKGVNVNLATGTGQGGHAEDDTLMRIENLTGSAFADTLTGDDGDNRIDGGDGEDVLEGGDGGDWLDGGLGVDRAVYAGSDAGVTVNLGAGIARGGFAKGDILTGIEHLTGSTHADWLTGDGGANWLVGGAGADVLNGGASRDWLSGGDGADVLDGGAGNDWLSGGAGADIFVFKPADGVVADTIADFQDGTDSIRIHSTVSFGDLTMTGSGGHASVAWGANTLTFEGLDRNLLTADDFLFV